MRPPLAPRVSLGVFARATAAVRWVLGRVAIECKVTFMEVAFRALHGRRDDTLVVNAVVEPRHVAFRAAQIHDFVLLLPTEHRRQLREIDFWCVHRPNQSLQRTRLLRDGCGHFNSFTSW